MENISILKRIKLFIASIGFDLFIWGNSTTQEIYWKQIYEAEKTLREKIEI